MDKVKIAVIGIGLLQIHKCSPFNKLWQEETVCRLINQVALYHPAAKGVNGLNPPSVPLFQRGKYLK